MKLRKEQLEAVEKIKNGSIVCGDVGSGKSIVSLWYYFTKIGHGVLTDDEFVPMDKENLPQLIIITTAKKRDNMEWDEEMVPLALSTVNAGYYDKPVIVDSWNNINKYVECEKCFFIFDEQRVVGKGAWVKAFLKITKKNLWILLSATPGDNWCDYIPVFIANGFYKNRREFEKEHVIYDRFSKYPRIDKYMNERKLRKYRDKILVDIPIEKFVKYNKVHIKCSYDINEYKSLYKNRWNVFENKPIENSSEMCFLLRRVVNSDADRINSLYNIYLEHKKIIIFYNYTFELEQIVDMCKNNSIPYSEWNGKNHQPIPPTDTWIYIVQYNAGAEGWNCISTDTMVFYSLNYSYKIMKQSAGRIDRLNTPFKILNYYYLESKSPIDIGISRAIKNKKNFQESAFIRKKQFA